MSTIFRVYLRAQAFHFSDMSFKDTILREYLLSYSERLPSFRKGSIATEVYNKVDEFSFPVVMVTFSSGDIPFQLAYDVF